MILLQLPEDSALWASLKYRSETSLSSTARKHLCPSLAGQIYEAESRDGKTTLDQIHYTLPLYSDRPTLVYTYIYIYIYIYSKFPYQFSGRMGFVAFVSPFYLYPLPMTPQVIRSCGRMFSEGPVALSYFAQLTFAAACAALVKVASIWLWGFEVIVRDRTLYQATASTHYPAGADKSSPFQISVQFKDLGP